MNGTFNRERQKYSKCYSCDNKNQKILKNEYCKLRIYWTHNHKQLDFDTKLVGELLIRAYNT